MRISSLVYPATPSITGTATSVTRLCHSLRQLHSEIEIKRKLEIIGQSIYRIAKKYQDIDPCSLTPIQRTAIQSTMQALRTVRADFEALKQENEAYRAVEQDFRVPPGGYNGASPGDPPHNQWAQAMEKWLNNKFPNLGNNAPEETYTLPEPTVPPTPPQKTMQRVVLEPSQTPFQWREPIYVHRMRQPSPKADPEEQDLADLASG